MTSLIRSKWFAVLMPAAIGLGASYLSANIANNYGGVLFLGLPVLVSFLSAFCYCFRRDRGFRNTYLVAALSITALGLMIIAFAMDGLICLLMALPLALILALPGSLIGRLA